MTSDVSLRVALHDNDQTGFPNYALMKIAAYHKAKGDSVEWWHPLEEYDVCIRAKYLPFRRKTSIFRMMW